MIHTIREMSYAGAKDGLVATTFITGPFGAMAVSVYSRELPTEEELALRRSRSGFAPLDEIDETGTISDAGAHTYGKHTYDPVLGTSPARAGEYVEVEEDEDAYDHVDLP